MPQEVDTQLTYVNLSFCCRVGCLACTSGPWDLCNRIPESHFLFCFPLVFLFPEWNRVDQSSIANTPWQWKGGLSLSNVSEFSRPLKYQTKPATKYCKRNVCFHPLQKKNNNMLWLLYVPKTSPQISLKNTHVFQFPEVASGPVNIFAGFTKAGTAW